MKNIRLKIYPWFLAFAIILNSAIAGDTNKFDGLMFEGATNFAKGDFDKAIADFSAIIQLDPTNDWAIFDRAGAYRAKGEFEKSIGDYDKYISLNSTNDLAFKNRACDLEAIGEFDKAISDLNEGLRLNPNDAIAFAVRGDCYSRKQQFSESLKDYYQAIRIDAKCESAWNNLGWLRATCPIASMRNGKEAVVAATKACELSIWMKSGWIDTLAAGYAEVGDFQQAVKCEKQALSLNKIDDTEHTAMQNRLAIYEKRQPYRDTRGQ